MKQPARRVLIVAAALVAQVRGLGWLAAQHGLGAASSRANASTRASAQPAGLITIDYPQEGSIFPPEITPPTFLWRDAAGGSTAWQIDITLGNGSPPLVVRSRGERPRLGEIDPRCVAETNQPPRLSPQQAAAHTWTPEVAAWEAIKKHSVEHPATVTITGLREGGAGEVLSRGQVTIQTSRDPVGAPIFYRDVPLMPSELEKGVIKPLAPKAMWLIAWRLRNLAEPRSRLLLEGMHTCANCHSFSRDGKTLGMDLDGPANNKGLYALASIQPQMSIRNEDVISWTSLQDKTAGQARIGFMSQVSPDGRYVVTTIKGPENETRGNFYVINFKDYRFLQVFYPTRGILAWYDRETGRHEALPGADDPRYVQTDAVWSPDGQFLVFARAEARDPYAEGQGLAKYANAPDETRIRYDLYCIPFNGGKGGKAEPIAGASQNGVSNTFPKVSPDGRWIVFVQCHNGQLMRPDSQLYIIPVEGGTPRHMRCNTPLMNSWHSFSPNGRWLVFSSKSRSPYTQMFLTHLDEAGNDSPAIYIDNSTAANRAVNIPEFVNIPPDGLQKIAVPAAEFYRVFDSAVALAAKGEEDAAIAEWKKALELDPADPQARNNLGLHLLRKGEAGQAVTHFQKAVEADPEFADAQTNLGIALGQLQRLDEAIVHFEKALQLKPRDAQAYYNAGAALYMLGQTATALARWREGLEFDANNLPILSQMAWVLATSPAASVRNGNEAVKIAERAVQLSGGRDPAALDTLAAAYAEAGRFSEAIETARRAVSLATTDHLQPLAEGLKARIALYQNKTPFRDSQ